MSRAVRNVVLLGKSPITRFFSAIVAGGGAFPTAADQAAYKALILGLMNAGLWAKLDLLHVMAAQDEVAALLNLKNPAAFPLVKAGTLVFTAYRGYAGNAVDGRLSAALNVSTANVNFSLNDAVAGVFVQTLSVVNSAVEHFVASTSRIQIASNGLTYQGRINDAASANIGAGAPSAGHWAAKRSGATARSFWKNGVSVANDAQVSTSLGTSVQVLSTGAANFSSSRIAAQYIGGGFSDADMATMNTLLTAYMTTVGAA